MSYVGKVGELLLPRTSCSIIFQTVSSLRLSSTTVTFLEKIFCSDPVSNQFSSLGIRNEIPHPYKTTAKIKTIMFYYLCCHLINIIVQDVHEMNSNGLSTSASPSERLSVCPHDSTEELLDGFG
jgi:hypothetical protein